MHRCRPIGTPKTQVRSDLTRSLGVAADDLDTIGMDLALGFELEVDVFDYERPDVVTETVRIEMSLQIAH